MLSCSKALAHLANLSVWDHELFYDDLQVLLLGVFGGASEARGQAGRAEAEAEVKLSLKVALESPSISRTWTLPGAQGLALKSRQTLQKFWLTLHRHQQDHTKMVNPTMHQQVILPLRHIVSLVHLIYCCMATCSVLHMLSLMSIWLQSVHLQHITVS